MDMSAVATSEWTGASATLLVGLVLAFAVKRAIRAASKPLRLDEDVARVLTRLVISLVLIFTVVGALNQLGVEIGPLLGALGIGSVLIALSLQPVLGNLVGSVMLDARRPIRRGDQVHTNGQSGTVVDINGRAVVLKTFDGEVVYLPNLKVLDEPLINQTRDEYRRTVMPFQVAYDTDLRLAQKALVGELRTLPALELAPPADVIVTGFGESGIDMAARFWHPSEELTARWVISEVAIAIRETLAREDITIPFRQVVFHAADTNSNGSDNGSTPDELFTGSIGADETTPSRHPYEA
jgi:small-conductance mechanosensitive channel